MMVDEDEGDRARDESARLPEPTIAELRTRLACARALGRHDRASAIADRILERIGYAIPGA